MMASSKVTKLSKLLSGQNTRWQWHLWVIVIINTGEWNLENSPIYIKVNPSRPNPGRTEKIKLNFYFLTFLWCLKKTINWNDRNVTRVSISPFNCREETTCPLVHAINFASFMTVKCHQRKLQETISLQWLQKILLKTCNTNVKSFFKYKRRKSIYIIIQFVMGIKEKSRFIISIVYKGQD